MYFKDEIKVRVLIVEQVRDLSMQIILKLNGVMYRLLVFGQSLH